MSEREYPFPMKPPRQIYLELTDGVSVGVDIDEALALDRKGFAALYRRHVYGAKRKEALAWADKQIEARADHLRG